MSPGRRIAVVGLLGVWLLGCDGERASTAPPSASTVPSVATPSTPPSAPTTSRDVDEDETSTRPVELLAFQFTSGVKNKAPIDALKRAQVGQRVHAHLTLRNRTGRKRAVELRFRIGDELRTELRLEVGEAWSWRTWGYNTILEKDRGKRLVLEVIDDEGHPLVDAELPIE